MLIENLIILFRYYENERAARFQHQAHRLQVASMVVALTGIVMVLIQRSPPNSGAIIFALPIVIIMANIYGLVLCQKLYDRSKRYSKRAKRARNIIFSNVSEIEDAYNAGYDAKEMLGWIPLHYVISAMFIFDIIAGLGVLIYFGCQVNDPCHFN